MSELLSDVIEQVYKNKRRVIGIKCDNCNCIIPAVKDPVTNKYTNEYFNVVTGHHEWFNDSCDSIEYFDVCPKCINKFMTDYFHNSSYASAYMEVKRRHVYPTIKLSDS